MGFTEAVKHVFQNYATFSGRARRSEYWYFTLFNVLVITVLSILSSVIGVASYSRSSGAAAAGSLIGSGLMMVYSLATMIPGLAVTCRRLHDVGKAGTYILFALIPFVGSILLLVWECQDSMPGPNQYGPYPKAEASYWSGGAAGAAAGGAVPPRQVPQSAPPTQALPYAPQGAAQFMLQGLSGEFAGKRVPVSGSVLVGRVQGCGVCFSPNAGGVSGRHCQLTVDGGCLFVRDLGSTYGTYLNGNNRLQPNQYYPLKAGDRIFIGSGQQCFAVVQ